MSKIVYDYIEEYIDRTHRQNEPFFTDLRKYAEENHIYIVKSPVEQLLKTLVTILKPKRILEVGTAIGYSALLMHSCVPNVHITTIERDETVLEMAKENIRLRNAQNDIRCIFGDATEVLEHMQDTFDFAFIDAAKGQYRTHFDFAVKMMKPGSVIVTDDVLYMGMTASDEIATKKHITITRRLREFLDYLCSDKRFETTILPIGDGVAITYIKE